MGLTFVVEDVAHVPSEGETRMMPNRHVWGLGAAAAVVVGLLMPMESAVAVSNCVWNTTGTTQSLAGDCTVDSTFVVPDGTTIDGNGHKITVDSGTPFSGNAVFTNAAGSGGAPATMTIGHLNIAGVPAGVDGILFDGAKGRANEVTVTGGQYGVEINNTPGATFASTDQVKVDNNSAFSGYHSAAVHVTGGMRFTVLRASIGTPGGGADANVAGVLVDSLAHGAVTESHFTLTHSGTASSSAYRSGVRISHTLRVEVKRNVFTGTEADFAVSVENPALSQKTTAAVDCNLFRANTTAASNPYGVGVGQWSSDKKFVNVVLTNATFEGTWNHKTGTVSGNTVSAGATNVHTNHCPPSAPTHVSAPGGNHRTKVSWRSGAALNYAPITGYQVSAKAAGHKAVKKTVGATARTTTLKGLNNKLNYVVSVTALSNGGKAAGKDKLFSTHLGLTASPKAIHRGRQAVLSGQLKSADSSIRLSKRSVEIWAKPKGGKWKKIATVKTKGGGHFSKAVKPAKRTTYRAVYGGKPGLASSHLATVVVR